MMVLIFLIVGNNIKGHKVDIWNRLQWIYIPLLIIVIFSGIGVPYITNRVCVSLYQMPIVLILALTGTLCIIGISKRINTSRILEYLGRNSLVIYLAHFIFYRIYLSIVVDWFNLSWLISLGLFLGVIVANVATCCLLARILNTRYLKWVLGKF